MLWVGLTGGIGAGKSAVSRRLVQRGATVVDADVIAREVVAPGTRGLAAVVETFGDVLAPDGSLDRERLGRVVFADEDARRRLDGIVHPLVGERTVLLAAEAEVSGAAVLVHDVPLLVENRLAPTYHLVVVVEAPLEVRLHRLTALRGMPDEDARARIAAQATDERRRAVADVLLDNGGRLEDLHAAVDRLWDDRLVPFAENLAAGRPAARGGAEHLPADPGPASTGERLVARLRLLCGARASVVEHVASAAGPGRAGQHLDDLQVGCRSWDDVEALGPVLAAGGFPPVDTADDQREWHGQADPAGWRTRLHRSADPGRRVDVRVGLQGARGRATAAPGDSEV